MNILPEVDFLIIRLMKDSDELVDKSPFGLCGKKGRVLLMSWIKKVSKGLLFISKQVQLKKVGSSIND